MKAAGARSQKPAGRQKGRADRPGLFLRLLQGIVWLAGRRPGAFGGSALFAIVFAFVAANALWYQPGQHPAPWLRTRLPFTHPQPERLASTQATPDNVTTFLIEREDGHSDDAKNSALKPARPAAPASGPQTAVQEAVSYETVAPDQSAAGPATPATADDRDLVQRVQQALKTAGFYSGPVDGRRGPRTEAAIRSFERQARLPETGAPSEDLLVSLAASAPAPAGPVVTPRERPMQSPDLKTGGIDPVAAAIRAAENNPPAPAKIAASASKADLPPDPGLVMQIQRGLINLAYGDVTADGVAGDQTRAAIRHFEKHYRLPETGEPSQAVLKKMKAIGAV
ncbi:hypothetical protein BJF92_18600 [Rhizobium rhizosphaerae]|uniref:Peptidoglycan binding-like domain-containing protein n=1 Tax=Xaviernesmea rhizosphaerae TaxID=1672749 RepID=A0A1Q9ADQ0_9HYPH|nr:hypothetical protein BJF92_18600 [Xaviernesmea rhizosphaerae]